MQKEVTLTEAEQEFLRLNYRSMSDQKLAMRLGITKNKVYQNRNLMGLYRHSEPPQEFRQVKEEMFDHRKFSKFP